jgi:hypothetical protein
MHNAFSKWVRGPEAHAEYAHAGYGRILRPRYTLCVRVDAEAVDACLKWLERTRNEVDEFWESDEVPMPRVTLVRVNETMVLKADLTDDLRGGYEAGERGEEEECEVECEADRGLISAGTGLMYVLPDAYLGIHSSGDLDRWTGSLRLGL